jgi:hypothetical protein
VTGLLDDHVENDEAKLAIVEQPAAASAAPAAKTAVMSWVVDIPGLALMRAVGVVMAVSAASVSVFHVAVIVSIYRKSRYIEIVTDSDFGKDSGGI